MQTYARALRAESTDAERRLWYLLRSRRMLGLKFRRQHPIGPYIVDFVCFDCRLIIEVDGGQHNERAQADRRRDEGLNSRGFLVLRFWDNDVLTKTHEIMEEIWTLAWQRRPSPPPPLPLARERGMKVNGIPTDTKEFDPADT